MNKKLINKSLEEECNFSSSEHGIDTITKDANIGAIPDYPIPQRYNKLKLVLMPVNKYTYYFYWDFPSSFLHSQIVDLKDVSFHVVDENHDILADIKCGNDFGQYFYKLNKEAKYIKVIAVYKHGIQYKNLIESNMVKVFNTDIKFSKKDVWISKHEGFTEVIRASLNHFTIGMSSKNYVDEIERLKQYNRISQESLDSNFSSHTLGGN